MSVVATTELTRRFGPVIALDRLTVELPAAGVIGLVGPNGSGKSTLIRILLGLIRPTAGSASVLGSSVHHPRDYATRVGVLIEGPAFIPALSARANLVSLAHLRHLSLDRVDAVLAQVGLVGRDREPVKRFSLGTKQRLGIAAALLSDPELLILDEPTNGLDPAGIVEIRELLRELGRNGRTVIVSSHQLSEIEAVCDHLVVIRFGELIFSGPMAEVMKRTREHIDIVAEHTADMGRLEAALAGGGWSVSAVGGVLRVAAGAARAGGPQPGRGGRRHHPEPAGRRPGQPGGDLPRDDRAGGRRAGERPRGDERQGGVMIAATRSELTRLRQPRLLLTWFGLMALFTLLVNTIMVTFVSGGGSLPPGAPGVAFPTLAEMESPSGLMSGLAAASNMFGIVTLSLWAVVTAGDYSSGLIRLLVAAEPRRWRLLAGKVVALVIVTAAATTVAAIVNVFAVMPAAGAAGISTAAWGTDLVSVVGSAWTNLFLALCVWGVLGLVIAVLARSAAVAAWGMCSSWSRSSRW